MISFDDDDNILSTEVAAITIVSNGFDGGEDSFEYPGCAAPGSTLTTSEVQPDGNGGKRRSHGSLHCERHQSVVKLVYANLQGVRISFDLRDDSLNAASFVIFVDDPGGTDIVAEKGGVVLDSRDFSTIQDYRTVVEMVLEDGIISPSEDPAPLGHATAIEH